MKKVKMLGLGIFTAVLLVGCSNMYNNNKEELGTMMMIDKDGQMCEIMMKDGKVYKVGY